MIENVRGFLDAVFEDYRLHLKKKLEKLGYVADWRLLNASEFGVPQLRPRVVIVALRRELSEHFYWPKVAAHNPLSVGETLYDMMAAKGWHGAGAWRERANEIAPTIVGGSKKHGGPDLGPTRARKAWATLGVNGLSLAEEEPERDFVGMPRLTMRMVARLQGFPDDWKYAGKKTTAYRQVGNAFPPPVARAVAAQIKLALSARKPATVRKIKIIAGGIQKVRAGFCSCACQSLRRVDHFINRRAYQRGKLLFQLLKSPSLFQQRRFKAFHNRIVAVRRSQRRMANRSHA